MLTIDPKDLVVTDKAFTGLVDLVRNAAGALRAADRSRKADWLEDRLAFYLDWIYTTQPELQAAFFSAYADQILDWGHIAAMVKESIAENMDAILARAQEEDAHSERRQKWIELHLRE